MTTQARWMIEKNKILNLSLEEKRKLYKSDFLTLATVNTWAEYAKQNELSFDKNHELEDLAEFQKITINPDHNKRLADKVSIFRGDITKLEIDAIVNAANSRLKAGGGVDGAIHRAAGPLLQEECSSLNGCPTGEAKITGGYDLPAKYVIHTVGPQDGSESKLRSCYEKCLSYQFEYRLKSIAFPCISTGIYRFPNNLAGHVALSTARKFLEGNEDVVALIRLMVYVWSASTIKDNINAVRLMTQTDKSDSPTDSDEPRHRIKRKFRGNWFSHYQETAVAYEKAVEAIPNCKWVVLPSVVPSDVAMY
ncbi:O-acetyl-ADP-ribose deacetylase MACROD2 [Eumeta japonica]|uniref:O-acetyl-ADP-ribose deacetylase MACROD2 n=1 Tax=Eumeta variegata TaxID=151549 RepID=A0A4C1UJE5_EUMVA|nr:O-acetyl-ADP-ribose deacetylase MACROD2 [Eumeta japonica]